MNLDWQDVAIAALVVVGVLGGLLMSGRDGPGFPGKLHVNLPPTDPRPDKPIPAPRALPEPRDLIGMARGMTGGVPAEVWVRMIRDACDCGVDEYFGNWDHKQGHASSCPARGTGQDSPPSKKVAP